MKNDVPNLSQSSWQILDTVSEAYDTLKEFLFSGSAEEYYCEENFAQMVAAWKLQLILDARICGIEGELYQLETATGYWSNYCNLHEYVEMFREKCLQKFGFDADEYEFGEDDPDEVKFGLFKEEETLSFVGNMLDGDVFGKDTLYLAGLENFVITTGGCSGMSYLKVLLFKNTYFGNLYEQAKKHGMEEEESLVSMMQDLNRAFGCNGIWDNQCGCGEKNGVYYAYLTFYDAIDGYGSFTWIDINPKMVWHVSRAYCHAKQLEKMLEASDGKMSA